MGFNYNSLYGNFRQLKFSDVWQDADKFEEDYRDSGLAPAVNSISEDSCKSLFYLLYSRYGNSTIASSDINQFQYQVFSTIFNYGPTWEEKLAVQYKLRNLTSDDLEKGNTTILNHALNPSTAPTTEELTYVSEQNVSKVKKGKLEQYTQLYLILEDDVTSAFLDRFQKLFLSVVQPEQPLWYNTTLTMEDNYDY